MDMQEVRLAAHRRLLVTVVALLADDPEKRRVLEEFARENEIPSDQEEDPGIVPGDAFAMQGAADEEIRAILRHALARQAARARQSG